MCSCCNLLWSNSITFFVRASEHLGITTLTSRFVETPKKFVIFDHVLLDGHKDSFDNFSILLKESNAFKLQLKEFLFITDFNQKYLVISLGTVWLIITLLLLLYLFLSLCIMSVHHYYCKIVITVKLLQFDYASSWSESLLVINILWIRCKHFRIFCHCF